MKKGTPYHHKMYDLARALKTPLPMAVGILEMLWQFVGDKRPQGDIGSLPDRDIANAVGWTKKPQLLIDALCEARWLNRNQEHRLIVHDWAEHCEYEVCRKLLNSSKDFLPVYEKSARDRRAPARSTRAETGEMRASHEAKAVGNGLLDDFPDFRAACLACGLSFSEQDMALAKPVWSGLDFESKALSIKGLHDRKQCGEFDDPAFRPLPQNYLSKRQWKRALRVKNTRMAATAMTTAIYGTGPRCGNCLDTGIDCRGGDLAPRKACSCEAGKRAQL